MEEDGNNAIIQALLGVGPSPPMDPSGQPTNTQDPLNALLEQMGQNPNDREAQLAALLAQILKGSPVEEVPPIAAMEEQPPQAMEQDPFAEMGGPY
jgi:hypothetical protein